MKPKSTIIGIVCLISMLISVPAYTQTVISAGDVSGVWSKANSPYLINGNIDIPDNLTLTIEPGVRVEFQDYYRFEIYGTLLAEGKVGDTIVMTIVDSAGFHNRADSAGSWGGLRFDNGANEDNDSTKIEFCKIEFCKSMGASNREYWGGAMLIDGFSRITIKNSLFQYNYANYGGAIALNANTITIENCNFKYNEAQSVGGGLFAQTANVKLLNNSFTDNYTAGDGGGVSFWGGSKFTMENNTIAYNKADGYGGGIKSLASTLDAVNNKIVNNEAMSGAGIACQSSYPTLINNLIANNTGSGIGGGINLFISDAKMAGNTIVNNAAAASGGINISQSNPEIYNTIFYGNSPEQISIADKNSELQIYYSCIEGGLAGFNISSASFYGRYENNIEDDPLFEAPTANAGSAFQALEANWRLTESSPLINLGIQEINDYIFPKLDIYGQDRVRNRGIDIGAAETHISSRMVGGTISANQYWFADTVKVISSLTLIDNYTITINPGTIVQVEGNYEFIISGTLLAEGNETDSIKFTCHPDDIDIGWQGIYFNNESGDMFDNDSSKMQYCIIEYGNKVNGGGVECKFMSLLEIANSEFRYNTASYKGGGLVAEYCSPTIKNCYFHHNTANRGGGIAADHASPLIVGNLFEYNTASENDFGGGVFGWFSNFILANNVIKNNTGDGVMVFAANSKPYYLINNLIVNNSADGVSVSDDELKMYNNTISNNGDNGIRVSNASLELYNSILWGQNTSIYPWGDQTSVFISNSNIQGGIAGIISPNSNPIVSKNIIDADPIFVEPTGGQGSTFVTKAEDWRLLSVSPCINSGINNVELSIIPTTDALGMPRVNDTIVDMGAIENQMSEVKFIRQPTNQVKCEGESVMFSVNLSDHANIQWYKNGAELIGEQGNTLVINTLTSFDEANYNCVATNVYGSVSSNNVFLLVKTLPRINQSQSAITICEDEEFSLSITGSGTNPITFQWQKNEVDIVSEQRTYFEVLSALASDAGNYTCIAENVCGVDTSDIFTVVVNELPNTSIGNDTTICANTGFELDAGADMVTYQWNNYESGRFLEIDSSYMYFARITDSKGCSNFTDSITISISKTYQDQEICMVTLDTDTAKNLVVWEKPERGSIVSFNIYKESAAEVYALLDNVLFDEASEYVDLNSDPAVKSDRYKISVVDTCGNESELSNFHKTMHLTANVGTGGETNLIWENYEGFYFGYYYIYRGTSKSDLQIIDSIQSNLTTYTDQNPPSGRLYYQIEIRKDAPCLGGTKANGGPYANSLSNIDDNSFEQVCKPNAGVDMIFCDKLSYTLNGALSQVGASGYWSSANQNLAFIDSTDMQTIVTVTQPGTYHISLIENMGGCSGTDELVLIFSSKPEENFISGFKEVIVGEIESYYVAENVSSSYNWDINLGEIISGSNTNFVQVKWNSHGQGQLYVVETNEHGCVGDTAKLQVQVFSEGSNICKPNAGIDDVVCDLLNYELIGSLSSENSTAFWYCSNENVVFTNQSNVNTMVTVPDYGVYTFVLNEQSDSCSGSDELQVTFAINPLTSQINGPDEVVTGNMISYYVDETEGSHYSWIADGGNIITGQGSNYIVVNWENVQNGELFVTEESGFGCTGQTINKYITITPVGIENVDLNSGVQFYPNPFNTTISIELINKQNAAVIFELFTLLGEKVLIKEWENNMPNEEVYEIDLSPYSLNKGIYIIRCSVDNKQFIQKMIKE